MSTHGNEEKATPNQDFPIFEPEPEPHVANPNKYKRNQTNCPSDSDEQGRGLNLRIGRLADGNYLFTDPIDLDADDHYWDVADEGVTFKPHFEKEGRYQKPQDGEFSGCLDPQNISIDQIQEAQLRQSSTSGDQLLLNLDVRLSEVGCNRSLWPEQTLPSHRHRHEGEQARQR
jgi:hypothetical protein